MLLLEVQGDYCAGAYRWPELTDDTSYDIPAGEPATTVGPLGDQLHQHILTAELQWQWGFFYNPVGDVLCRLI